jgi:hypothetical protein
MIAVRLNYDVASQIISMLLVRTSPPISAALLLHTMPNTFLPSNDGLYGSDGMQSILHLR